MKIRIIKPKNNKIQQFKLALKILFNQDFYWNIAFLIRRNRRKKNVDITAKKEFHELQKKLSHSKIIRNKNGNLSPLVLPYMYYPFEAKNEVFTELPQNIPKDLFKIVRNLDLQIAGCYENSIMDDITIYIIPYFSANETSPCQFEWHWFNSKFSTWYSNLVITDNVKHVINEILLYEKAFYFELVPHTTK